MKDDQATLAAIGVAAGCLTAFDHEVLGHGIACLLNAGAVVHVSTSLFACSAPSPFVAAGGPAGNLAMASLALVVGRLLPARETGWRLFCLAMTAFGFFWEGGYLVKAMLGGDGDLYFFARGLFGPAETAWRIAGGVAGALFYMAAWRLVSARLTAIFPEAARARRGARWLWLGGAAAVVVAALVFTGPFWPNLRDTALEIGLAASPLLVLPRGDGTGAEAPALMRNRAAIAFAACLFIAFAATQGHGLGSF